MSEAGSGAGLLVETPVIERVLGAALRRGGDFAEVFVEDRHSTSAVLDDGRVEELSSGRDRGAGVRVVVGETTGLRPHRRPVRGSVCWPRPRPPRPSPGKVAAAASVALEQRDAREEERRGQAPRGGPQGPQDRAPGPGRRRRPRQRERHLAGVGLLRRRPAAHPGGQQRRRPRRRRPGPIALQRVVRGGRRHRHADRLRVQRVHGGLRVVRHRRRSRGRRHRGAPGARQADGASRAERRGPADPGIGQRWHPLPRGVRARPRGGPHRQGRVGLRGPGGRAGGEPARHAGRRRHHRAGVGQLRRRRRGESGPAQRAHRERRAHRLHVGLPARRARSTGSPRATAGARATATCPWSG